MAKYKLNSQSDTTANLETLESVVEIIEIKTTVIIMQQPLHGGARRDVGIILRGIMASSNKKYLNHSNTRGKGGQEGRGTLSNSRLHTYCRDPWAHCIQYKGTGLRAFGTAGLTLFVNVVVILPIVRNNEVMKNLLDFPIWTKTVAQPLLVHLSLQSVLHLDWFSFLRKRLWQNPTRHFSQNIRLSSSFSLWETKRFMFLLQSL